MGSLHCLWLLESGWIKVTLSFIIMMHGGFTVAPGGHAILLSLAAR